MDDEQQHVKQETLYDREANEWQRAKPKRRRPAYSCLRCFGMHAVSPVDGDDGQQSPTDANANAIRVQTPLQLLRRGRSPLCVMEDRANPSSGDCVFAGPSVDRRRERAASGSGRQRHVPPNRQPTPRHTIGFPGVSRRLGCRQCKLKGHLSFNFSFSIDTRRPAGLIREPPSDRCRLSRLLDPLWSAS